MPAEVATPGLLDGVKRIIATKQSDPDKDHPEYDVWGESRCGKTNVVTLNDPTRGVIKLTWQGETCLLGCIELKCCRVGSNHIRDIQGGFEPHMRALPVEKGFILSIRLMS